MNASDREKEDATDDANKGVFQKHSAKTRSYMF